MVKRGRRGLGEAAGFGLARHGSPTPHEAIAVPALPDTPHYAGHRDRLRERFEAAGADALPDYELLELVLFRSIPRRDVKPLAKALIRRFGSIADIAGASVPRLMEVDGIGHATALDLRIIAAFSSRAMKADVARRDVLSSIASVVDYLGASMGQLGREQFRILFLDNRNGLIADEVQHEGTVDYTPVTPREIMRRALELDAVSIVLCHNHPSGDVTPSLADIDMTRQIIGMATPLGIRVHDHIIVGRGKSLSMRTERYID
ncbi:RadC family protein [Aureimonas altamirensis]|uniref:RadC family protein n=1 Tax=Aureimonas altamirensis TaxID=370622 RepID=UPI0009DEEDA3|nr:DNA repair protein RadC [Aureimonas altamirensis]